MRIQATLSIYLSVDHILPFRLGHKIAVGDLYTKVMVGIRPESKSLFFITYILRPLVFRTCVGFGDIMKIPALDVRPQYELDRLGIIQTVLDAPGRLTGKGQLHGILVGPHF